MEEALEDAFLLCTEARRDYENDPTDERHEEYMRAREVFRKCVIVEQLSSLTKLITYYKDISTALIDLWTEMATIDRWLRMENLNSPLPKNFIKDLSVPYLGNKKPLCGTTAEVPSFNFSRRYSADAQRVWDDTYFYHNDFEREFEYR